MSSDLARGLATRPWWDTNVKSTATKPFTAAQEIHKLSPGLPDSPEIPQQKQDIMYQSKWAPKQQQYESTVKLITSPSTKAEAPPSDPKIGGGPQLEYEDSHMGGAEVDGAIKPFALSATARPFEAINPSISSGYDEDGDVVMTDLEGFAVIRDVAEAIAGGRDEARIRGGEAQSTDPGQRISDPSCLLVLDTNFIISHLRLVDSLVLAHSAWRNVVVLPWATIQELDGLKKANLEKSYPPGSKGRGKTREVDIGRLARSAIRWAHRMFERLEPGIWGQLREEMHNPGAAFGDASILDCCRYFKGQGYRTVLLTNDQNLAVKALTYSIRTISYDSGLTTEKIFERSLGRVIPCPRVEAPELMVDFTGKGSASPALEKVVPRARGGLAELMTDVIEEEPESTVRWITRSQSFPAPVTTGVVGGINSKLLAMSFNSLGEQNTTERAARGLQDSIHAPRNGTRAVGNDRPHAIPIVNPTNGSIALAGGSAPTPLGAKAKSDVQAFLRRVETELIAHLVPCIKSHLYHTLGKQETLDYLGIFPEIQVNSLFGLELFLNKHGPTVFPHLLPRALCVDLRRHKLSGLFRGWMAWTMTPADHVPGTPDRAQPTESQLRDWVDDVDFVWKRLVVDPGQVRSNRSAIDAWKSVVQGLGLAK